MRDLCDGGETVPDNGMTCDFEERLEVELEWQMRGQDVDLHTFGRSRDRGLNRVPLEGPPT